jgi:hypothetical protein
LILGSIFKRASLFVASPTKLLEENPTMAMLFFCVKIKVQKNVNTSFAICQTP